MKRWLILCMLCVAFIGCAKKEAAQEPVKLWVGGQVAELGSSWDKILADFTKETDIPVDVQLFGFDTYYDRLVTSLEGGSGADVAFADLGGWVPTFASKGWLSPMDDFLDTWEGTDEIWSNLWPTVTYENSLYGVPWYTDDRLLLYNKKMFREAGLNPDAPPTTWDELLEVSKILTENGKLGYGLSGTQTEHTSLGFIVFLYGNGGQLLSDDYSSAAFNTQAGLETLEFYKELAEFSPNPVSYHEDDYRNLMAQNRVAMSIGGPWSFPLIEKANPEIVDDYSVALHPYGKSPASVLGGWALIVPESSKNKENAEKLIEYITTKDTWIYFLEENGGPMPSRRDAAEESPRLQSDPKWQTVLSVYPTAVPRPPIPEYPQISLEIQKMVQSVLLDEKSPEQALQDAERAVNRILGK